ncbi:MAG: bacteriohemerythrin [Lachnospiraceae bacterium]
MFTFTKDCMIGVPEIDAEHRRLFELIAETDATLTNHQGSMDQAVLLINELKQYAVTHFSHEEAYMEKTNDPELNRQKAEHAAFIEKVKSYPYTSVTDESARGVMLDLLEYLSRWLVGHILGSDIMIGHFTKEERPTVPVFDDTFKTGIELVDEEHRKLFEIIGKIHATIEAELVHDKFDSIMEIIDELKDYTQFHFADEEEYMRRIGYDGLEKQQILHQSFVEKMKELNLDDVDENQEAYLYDFLEFLQNWLINHILKVDKLIPKA